MSSSTLPGIARPVQAPPAQALHDDSSAPRHWLFWRLFLPAAALTLLLAIMAGLPPQPAATVVAEAPPTLAFLPPTADGWIESEPFVVPAGAPHRQLVVAGGEYAVDGRRFTVLPGLVRPGSEIRVRVRAIPGGEARATVVMGGHRLYVSVRPGDGTR